MWRHLIDFDIEHVLETYKPWQTTGVNVWLVLLCLVPGLRFHLAVLHRDRAVLSGWGLGLVGFVTCAFPSSTTLCHQPSALELALPEWFRSHRKGSGSEVIGLGLHAMYTRFPDARFHSVQVTQSHPAINTRHYSTCLHFRPATGCYSTHFGLEDIFDVRSHKRAWIRTCDPSQVPSHTG